MNDEVNAEWGGRGTRANAKEKGKRKNAAVIAANHR